MKSSVETEKMFSQLKIVKTKLSTQMSQDKINVTTVDKLKNTKQMII